MLIATAVIAALSLLFTAVVTAAPASAEVTPNVDVDLATGESVPTVVKSVTVPDVPTNVQVCVAVDVSGSFGDDLVNLRAQASAITAVVSSADTATFGLADYSDYPVAPHGYGPDRPYTLVTPLTDATTWEAAVDSLSLRYGGDGSESQLDAIYGAVNGLDGWGEPCGFTDGLGTTRILIATTDAACHEPSATKPHQHSTADVIDTLVANDVVFIGLASGPSASSCFQPLADATGGVVESLAGDGSNITAAITAALGEVTYNVAPEIGADCDGIDVTFTPASYADVAPGSTVTFDEDITYTGTGTDTIVCTIGFGAAGNQTITVTPIVETLGDQGCTPGYWKQPHHAEAWGSTDPTALFSDVFGVGPDITLLEAAAVKGGQFDALTRHAVAAYLNATSDDVAYAMYSWDVVALVADAWATGDWATAKAALQTANEAGCPL